MTQEMLALFLAGIFAPIVFQALGKFGLSGRPAQWAAIAFAYAVAMLAWWVTGGAITPEAVIEQGSPVALLALLLYRQVIQPYLPPEAPPALTIPPR